MTQQTMADVLQEYGRRSAYGLERMGRDVSRFIEKRSPDVSQMAEALAPFFLGNASMDSVRLGGEAGRLWDDGKRGEALVRMGDAILAPLDELYFLMPQLRAVKGPK